MNLKPGDDFQFYLELIKLKQQNPKNYEKLLKDLEDVMRDVAKIGMSLVKEFN